MTLKMSTYVACSTQTFKSSVNLQTNSMNSECDEVSLEALLSSDKSIVVFLLSIDIELDEF